MPEEKWDYDTTIKFIRLIHARPIIWKKDLQEFIQTSDKEAAISDVAVRMKTYPARIKDKLRRMKEACYQEEIRMQTFNDHVPRWNYFHQFRFVLKADNANCCVKREEEVAAEAELDEVDEIFWVDDVCKKETLLDESDMIETTTPPNLNSACENNQNDEDDEFTVLGENIANELRRLEKNEALQTKLKNQITLAMLEAIEDVTKQKIKQ